MKALIVYAHPNPKSFNGGILEMVHEELNMAGHEMRTHDLYKANFNPILGVDDFTELFSGRVPGDVQPYQADIAWADLLLFIFPTWWASTPAILKGYFDRVLTNGFAFRYGPNGAEGLLKGKRAVVFQTTGTPGNVLNQAGMPDAMKATMDLGVIAFCGIEVVAHEFFYAVPSVSDSDRAEMLNRVRHTVRTVAGTGAAVT